MSADLLRTTLPFVGQPKFKYIKIGDSIVARAEIAAVNKLFGGIEIVFKGDKGLKMEVSLRHQDVDQVFEALFKDLNDST